MSSGEGMKGSTPLAMWADECLHRWAVMSHDQMLYGDEGTLRIGMDQQPEGPWKLHTLIDSRPMVLDIAVDPDATVCGHRSIECFWECRLPPRHDGPHIPFTKELLAVQPDLIIAAMRSERPDEGGMKFYRQVDGDWLWIRGIDGISLR